MCSMADVRRCTPLRTGQRSMLWDLGDEVWCLEFTGRVPALNQELLGPCSPPGPT